jgi:uncharacterized protein YqgV (UPF0045/DUF77 family)
LEDLGAVELLQLPHSGRKTGELIVVGWEAEARLYYDQGALRHAVCDDLTGLDVLVEVVGWKEGEFELRLGVEPPQTTIEMDLHRAMMHALKIRDERKRKREQSENATDEREEEEAMSEKMKRALASFVDQYDFVSYAAALSSGGELLSDGGSRPETLDQMVRALTALAEAHPRPGLSRVLLEDEAGTVVLESIDEKRRLLVLSAPEARMGAVVLGVSKLIGELEEAETND